MNEELNELKFKAVDADGRQIDCETLFMFESPETKKNYIVYTDNTLDEQGNTKVYASIYNPNEENTNLIPIETDKEWKIIETILDELQQQAREGLNGNEQQ